MLPREGTWNPLPLLLLLLLLLVEVTWPPK